jgi:hypothetical protein
MPILLYFYWYFINLQLLVDLHSSCFLSSQIFFISFIVQPTHFSCSSPISPRKLMYSFLDVSGVQAANTRQKLLADVKGAVKGAVAATIASHKSTITDEEPAGGVLFSALEASLMFGLRGMKHFS